MLDIEFAIDKYLDYKHRSDISVEQKLDKMVSCWRKGEADKEIKRVFTIAGCPGIGKTWLLLNTADTLSHQKGLIGWFRRHTFRILYINLLERFDKDKYRTGQVFANYWKDQIDMTAIDTLCLCVDHIPPPPGDTGLQILEKDVLLYALQKGAFLLLAQDHPNNWGLGTRIPHSVNKLSIFTNAGIEKILDQEAPTQKEWPMLIEYAAGNPLLARSIACKGLKKGISSFLTYWLEQKNIDIQLDELLSLALPLFQIEDLDTPQAARQTGLSNNELSHTQSLLRSIGWIEIHQRHDKRFEKRWAPSIKQSLEYLINTNLS